MTYSLSSSLARLMARFDASLARLRPLVWASLLAFAACASPSYGDPGDTSTPSTALGDGSVRTATVPSDGAAPSSAAGSAQAGTAAMEGGSGVSPTEGPTTQNDADAGPGADSADAGGPTTPALPLWAMPLIGQYAVLAYTGKEDDFRTVTIAEQVMKVDVVPHEGGLQLHSTTCRSAANSSIPAELLLLDPSSIPEQVSDVVFSETDQRWGTSPSTFPFGFTEDPPEVCKGKQGENVPHTPVQLWLSSTCRCPLPKEDPARDDCRILDPDHDRHPGVTYTLRGQTSSIADVDVYAAGEGGSYYKNGQVGMDGKIHTANVAASETVYQLDCSTGSCGNLAELGKYCPASKNRAQFVRLDPSSAPAGGYTCADIVSRKASLFSLKAPTFAETTCL